MPRSRKMYGSRLISVSVSVSSRTQNSGMWSRSRRLGLETVSRRTNVSSRSRLGLGPVRLGSRLGLDPKRLGSRGGLGPFRLVETFHAGAPNLTTILQ